MELNSFIKSFRFQIINGAFWFTLFLVTWLKRLLIEQTTSWENFIYHPGAYFLVLWLISPLVISLFITINTYTRNQQIKWHFIASIGFGIMHFVLVGFFILLLERLFKLEEHYNSSTLIHHYRNDWIYILDGVGWYAFYLIILLLMNYYLLFKNEKKRVVITESNLAHSNFQVLSTQLSPHFLFNAMNSIAMMVRKKENSRAVNMIASLSEMLRAAMSQKNDQLVPLKNELVLLNKYLSIEKARFKDRVEVTISFAEEVLVAAVPQLVLQPIVENAFKHGVENSQGKAEIKVQGIRVNNQLQLSVYNSGLNHVEWDITNSKSLGLPNTIHRLRQLYGSDFNFKVIEQKEGILFEITIPFDEKFISQH